MFFVNTVYCDLIQYKCLHISYRGCYVFKINTFQILYYIWIIYTSGYHLHYDLFIMEVHNIFVKMVSISLCKSCVTLCSKLMN